MLKSKSLIPHDRPVYRQVIPQALAFAWKHPLFWLFGIFAAAFNTSGALDVFWKFLTAIQTQGNDIFVGHAAMRIWQAAQIGNTPGIHWLPLARGLVGVLLFVVLFLAVAGMSFIAQGALVYSIGSWNSGGRKAFFKKALTIGAQALVPIAVLNIILVVFIWIARFGVSLPLAMSLGSDNILFQILYVICFVLFTLLALMFSIMQVYALNAMIHQGASLAQAMVISWKVIKQHWLMTLETAILQTLVIGLLALVATIVMTLLTLPPILLFTFSVMSSNVMLMEVSVGILVAVLFILLLVFGGFTVTFQYATWTMIFRKFGEGGVRPKLHRLFRNFLGLTKVPQA